MDEYNEAYELTCSHPEHISERGEVYPYIYIVYGSEPDEKLWKNFGDTAEESDCDECESDCD